MVGNLNDILRIANVARHPQQTLRWSRAAALVAAAMTVGAADQPPARIADPEIVVRAPPSRKDAAALARKFTQSDAGGTIARWNNWICLSIQGPTPDRNAMLVSRIKSDAAIAGVRVVDDRPCTWNVLVAFTADADDFTAKLVKVHPGLFRDFTRYGLAPLHEREVLAAPRPVRWLPIETAVTAVGSAAGPTREDASHINDASHISTNVRGDKAGELIIVDPERASGVTWQQLADYLSMVILTDPGMEDRFKADQSIMSIFADHAEGRAGPPELTLDDRRVLRGYYAFDPYVDRHYQLTAIIDALRADAPPADKDHAVR